MSSPTYGQLKLREISVFTFRVVGKRSLTD